MQMITINYVYQVNKPTVASNVLVRVKTSKITQPMAQMSDLKLYFAPWHNSGDM